MCGSAFKNKGVQRMLDAVISICLHRTTSLRSRVLWTTRQKPRLSVSFLDDAPFAALAFKIMNDKFVGSLTFIRVYSGVLKSVCGLEPGQEQARSAWVVSCRCTPTSVKKSTKSVRATSPPCRSEGCDHG
jgi:translation elongation factor EF-G